MLQKVNFQPGFNKQVTSTGGEGQWVDGDNVRFRYGYPEKIGGWAQLGSVDITGRNTAIHHFINTNDIKQNNPSRTRGIVLFELYFFKIIFYVLTLF